jgi:hypothetical protein
VTYRFMETATIIKTVKRLVTLNGWGTIPANTLHYIQKGFEAQILLRIQEQSFGLDIVNGVPVSLEEVRRDNAARLANVSRLPLCSGRQGFPYLRTKFAETT